MNQATPFTQKISYPQKLYLYAIWFTFQDKTMLYFMQEMFSDLSTLYFEAKLTIRELQKSEVEKRKILSTILVIPTTFHKDIRHKKAYWDTPSVDISFIDRTNAFASALMYHELYDLLVTPIIKDKRTDFTSAMVFKKGADNELKTFMRYSTHPVSIEAANSALYSIEESYGYDLSTHTIVENTPSLQ